MTEADIAIVGAGPAGAAAGVMLAPHCRVVLIDRQREPALRIGESLIPAARRLLRNMGILEAFEAEGHEAYLGNRSHWGSAVAQEVDFLRDPNGPGWHLDRPRFERFLRAAAEHRGAQLMAPAKLRDVKQHGTRWRLTLDTDTAPRSVTAQLLVDAGGRGAPLARRLGAERRNTDRLIAAWLRGTVTREDGATAGFSRVESEPDGWWYTAPVPGGSGRPARVLAFHTDADLSTASIGDAADLLNRARRLPGIGEILDRTGFTADDLARTTAANSAVLEEPIGNGWIAIGDAALSFDPLASRGLFNALYTALVGAVACREILEGAAADFTPYAADLARVRQAYDRHLALAYAAEPRWPGSPFWARRTPRKAAGGPVSVQNGMKAELQTVRGHVPALQRAKEVLE